MYRTSPASASLVRVAQKMAASMKADWFAIYVEDPRMLRLPETGRSRAVYNLRLAEQLEAEAITLRGRGIAGNHNPTRYTMMRLGNSK